MPLRPLSLTAKMARLLLLAGVVVVIGYQLNKPSEEGLMYPLLSRPCIQGMTIGEVFYTGSWMLFCLGVAIALVREWKNFAQANQGYFPFLFQKWKVALFVIACAGITILGPYTGDFSWDYVTAPMMSVMTFLTAPWAVGIIYRADKKKAPMHYVIFAAAAWMLSASWMYDFYLFVRYGVYPVTWFANIFASSGLYLSAGLLWNLDYRPGRGVTFAFLEDDWFQVGDDKVFGKILWPVLIFVALGIGLLLPCFWLIKH